MAKASVVCTCKLCGLTFRKEATKTSRKEADSWESWAKDYFDECPDCAKRRVAGEHQKTYETSKPSDESLVDQGYKSLQGSDKQIAWATSIRVTQVGRLETYFSKLEAKVEKAEKNQEITEAQKAEVLKNIKTVRDFVKIQANSGWWIEHKDTHIYDIMDVALKAHK